MPTTDDANRDFLVSEICKISCLGGRFENLNCVNWPPKPGEEKRGFFSLVFSAFDLERGKRVAIKFMDPNHLIDDYRVNSFKREPKIMERFLGKSRCLQLVQGLNSHAIRIVLPTGMAVDFPCEYFVTEWLDYDIDDYFFSRDDSDAKTKLIVFRYIVSAIEAIHTNGVFHRDLKPDNMRATEEKLEDKVVFVIDFGTAAQYDSRKLLHEYSGQVGHSLYSAPETFLGFAGERAIAKHTDIYALGCMLYELFNDDFFLKEVVKNPAYHMLLTVLSSKLSLHSSIEGKLKCYDEELKFYGGMFQPPDFEADNCTLPASISGIIEPLYKQLVSFNYKTRIYDFELIRKRTDIAIRVLTNDALQRSILERKKALKQKAAEKVLMKQSRLIDYLEKRKRISC